MSDKEKIDIGFLDIILMGGDPYNPKNRLIMRNFGTGEETVYKVNSIFEQEINDDESLDINCPICNEVILDLSLMTEYEFEDEEGIDGISYSSYASGYICLSCKKWMILLSD